MGGSNHSRCFSATPCCWFSELPDVWHCLGLLRSGTREANQRALRTVPLAFHASVSPHSQGNVVWHHSCKEHLPQAKKTTHPFPSSCLAILRLTVPKIYLLRTPASPTKYHSSSQKREIFHCKRIASTRSFHLARKMLSGKYFSMLKRTAGMSTVPAGFLIRTKESNGFRSTRRAPTDSSLVFHSV